ncbi:RM17 protein, partial [Aphelocoma coerulescens]|nr:RM17 protein [Aphelocoma coerulescens]
MRLSLAAAISHGRVYRRLGLSPRSRLDLLRNLVTALLIDYAKRGDKDERAMRMADFWLTEKDLIHKLFKVLAPRFQPHPGSYTRLLQIPNRDGLDRAKMAVIELKGNPLPPLVRPRRDSDKTLLNQLLKGYRQDAQRAAAA